MQLGQVISRTTAAMPSTAASTSWPLPASLSGVSSGVTTTHSFVGGSRCRAAMARSMTSAACRRGDLDAGLVRLERLQGGSWLGSSGRHVVAAAVAQPAADQLCPADEVAEPHLGRPSRRRSR